jgi:hypothetical protein
MKWKSCKVETLSYGGIRVTARECGRTLCSKDGDPKDINALVDFVMGRAFSHLRTRQGYDLQYIDADKSTKESLRALGYVLTNE